MLSPPRRWTRHTATSHRRDSRTAQATVPNAGPEVRAATRCRGGLEQVRLRSDGVEREVREFEARGAIFEGYRRPDAEDGEPCRDDDLDPLPQKSGGTQWPSQPTFRR